MVEFHRQAAEELRRIAVELSGGLDRGGVLRAHIARHTKITVRTLTIWIGRLRRRDPEDRCVVAERLSESAGLITSPTMSRIRLSR